MYRQIASPYWDQKWLLKNRTPRIIFDVGANVGQTAQKYSSAFPKATIYSFEPFPDAFGALQKRFEGNPRVKPVSMALADKKGQIEFHVNEHKGHNSLFPPSESARQVVRPVKVIEVPVTTIDCYCEEQSLDRIDVLKMDIQGGELLALQGAIGMLQRGTIPLIYTEVMFAPTYQHQAEFHQLYSFLSGFGYTLFNFYSLRYLSSGQIKWADVVFLSPELQAAFPPNFG